MCPKSAYFYIKMYGKQPLANRLKLCLSLYKDPHFHGKSLKVVKFLKQHSMKIVFRIVNLKSKDIFQFMIHSDFYLFFLFHLLSFVMSDGLPSWISVKESAYQCRRCRRPRFDPWVRKIPWRRKYQPTIILPGKSHRQRSLSMGNKELGTNV